MLENSETSFMFVCVWCLFVLCLFPSVPFFLSFCKCHGAVMITVFRISDDIYVLKTGL